MPISKINYSVYLPLFIDGIREKLHPYKYVAIEGAKQLILGGISARILDSVPLVVRPLKVAMNTKDPTVLVEAIKILRMLTEVSPAVASALVPYYRQLLPVLSQFVGSTCKQYKVGKSDDYLDFAYGKQDFRTLPDLIQDTLRVLDATGGPDAFVNIKYMVPTFESCS